MPSIRSLLSRFAPGSTLLVLLVSVPLAATIHVPDDAPTIQSALDAAASGDLVQVAAGSYFENIIWPPVNGIQLVGAGPEFTTIDGMRVASVIRFEDPDVVDAATLVRGFTITNGMALPPWPESMGGGIYLFRAHPVLEDLRIVANEADDFGGGVYCWWANPTLVGVLIAGNTAISRGGVDCFHGSPHFDHVTVTGNDPGGLHFDTRFVPLVENCIVAFNPGYAIQVHGTYIEPTEIDLAYSDVLGGVQEIGVAEVNDLGGNIEADPSFVDTAVENYNLLASSPCIDSADPAAPVDPDGTRSDMGAYFFDQGVTGVGPFGVEASGALGFVIGPNPFGGRTEFAYVLPVAASVTLTVFDTRGRVVRVLMDGRAQGAGQQGGSWDGRDQSGRRVASGVYLVRLAAGERGEVRRVTFWR